MVINISDVHDGRFKHTQKLVCKHTHTHTHTRACTQSVLINVPREMLYLSWRRLNQHTHVTSLSGHFILLFKVLQTLHSGVSGGLLARKRDSSTAVPLVYPRAGLNLPRQAELCQGQKREDQAEKGFALCVDHLKVHSRRGAGVFMYCHLSLKKIVWICTSIFS